MALYFTPRQYPELKGLAKADRKQELEAFYKSRPQALTYIAVSSGAIVAVVAVFFVVPVSRAVFGYANFYTGALVGFVMVSVALSIVTPILTSGPIRGLFMDYWRNRRESADSADKQ